jgi:hypothetical protein
MSYGLQSTAVGDGKCMVPSAKQSKLGSSRLCHLFDFSFLFFFLVVLGFELRALHLQSRCSTACTTLQVHFVLVILSMGVFQSLCLGWPWNVIFLTSAFQVARIIRVSHPAPSTQLICLNYYCAVVPQHMELIPGLMSLSPSPHSTPTSFHLHCWPVPLIPDFLKEILGAFKIIPTLSFFADSDIAGLRVSGICGSHECLIMRHGRTATLEPPCWDSSEASSVCKWQPSEGFYAGKWPHLSAREVHEGLSQKTECPPSRHTHSGRSRWNEIRGKRLVCRACDESCPKRGHSELPPLLLALLPCTLWWPLNHSIHLGTPYKQVASCSSFSPQTLPQ